MTIRPSIRTNRGCRGTTVLEACAALALSAAAATTIVHGLEPLVCAFRVEVARSTLVDTLLEARRVAYLNEANAAVEARAGGRVVTLGWSGRQRALSDGVAITAAPSDGDVTFRGSGLADNATVTVACGASTASVVVNQRGVVR